MKDDLNEPGLDAKTLIDRAAWKPECDPLVTRAPRTTTENLKALIQRFRAERTIWGREKE